MPNKLLFPLYLALGALITMGCSNDPSPETTHLTPQNTPSIAIIESIEIQPFSDNANQIGVLVRGNLPDNCTVLADPSIEREGNQFRLNISARQDITEDCIRSQVPFEQRVSLEIQDLPRGSYLVTMGNQQVQFEVSKAEVVNPTATSTPDPQTMAQSATETAMEVTSIADGSEITITAAASATISGLIWHDRCAANELGADPPPAPPPGCILIDGDYLANGIIEQNEPGLGDILLDLGAGPCPATGIATQVSATDGTFSFTSLPPATYCVSIDSQSPHNANILRRGNWTFPSPGIGNTTIDLVTDDPPSQVNFGWDFIQQLGSEEIGCVEKAAFFEDVTIPDNTVFRPDESFVKTWRLRNEGTCPWGPDYDLIFSHGDQLNGPSNTPLPSVAPGEIVNLSVDLKAPETGGTYVGNWQLRNPDDIPFGVGINGKDFFWVQIAVSWFPSPEGPPVTPPPSTPPPPPTSTTCEVSFDTSFENELLSLINTARANQGFSSLTQQDLLTAAARRHSTDMACNDFVDHTGSDGSTWFERVSAAGYNYSYASENIYVGNPTFGGTPQGAFEWWMNSQVHRDNILFPVVSQIGVGYVFRSESEYGGYYTLVFASP